MQVQTRRVKSRPWRSRAVALVRRFDARRPGGASDDLRRARALLDEIEEERNRLASQRRTASVFARGFDRLNLSEIQTRVTSTDALIAQLEDFAGDAFPRMEAKAIAGDAEQAARLVRGCERILAAVRGVDMVKDTFHDARLFVDESLEDLKDVSRVGVGLAVAGALAYATLMLK